MLLGILLRFQAHCGQSVNAARKKSWSKGRFVCFLRRCAVGYFVDSPSCIISTVSDAFLRRHSIHRSLFAIAFIIDTLQSLLFA
jgi:hypothetical protein